MPPRPGPARALIGALIAGVVLAQCAPARAESVVRLPAPAYDPAVKAPRCNRSRISGSEKRQIAAVIGTVASSTRPV